MVLLWNCYCHSVVERGCLSSGVQLSRQTAYSFYFKSLFSVIVLLYSSVTHSDEWSLNKSYIQQSDLWCTHFLFLTLGLYFAYFHFLTRLWLLKGIILKESFGIFHHSLCLFSESPFGLHSGGEIHFPVQISCNIVTFSSLSFKFVFLNH